MDEMKSPQIIDTVDMVGMGMGEQHGVDPGDLFADGLLSEVGRCIHQDVVARGLDQDGSASPLVPWFEGSADRAGTANHRHAGGCAAAENGYLHGTSLGENRLN